MSSAACSKLNEPVEIVGIKDTQTSVATGIEMFRKPLDFCEAGDNVGILLRGIKREDIVRGQVLCKPGSVNPHTKLRGEVYILTKEEGGRHTPFFDGYRPQFYFRTTDVTGRSPPSRGHRDGHAWRQRHHRGELIHPIAMEEGLRFAIREGGHTVGSGRRQHDHRVASAFLVADLILGAGSLSVGPCHGPSADVDCQADSAQRRKM